MKRKISFVLLCMAMLLCLSACAQSAALTETLDDYKDILGKLEPLPTLEPSVEPTPKPTIKPRATAKPSPSPAPSEEPLSLAEESPEPEETEEPSPSPTPTPTPTPEPTPEPTPTPSPTPAPTPEPTPEPTFTPYPESMMAPLPGLVPYGTPKPTPTPKPEPTPTPEATAKPEPVPTRDPSSGSGQEIADFACQYVGYKYAYGEESPETGFDCSGLVYYVYQQFGHTLNRTAAAQALNGVHVELDAIEPGDILCFYNQGSYIGHCGIYIGGGQYVHSQDSSTGVVISPLSERTCRIEARRILE